MDEYVTFSYICPKSLNPHYSYVRPDNERNNNKTINQAACWKNFGKMFRISLLILYISTLIYADSFKEELLVQPLANNDLLASFNFVTVSPFSQSRQHFDLMPR